MSPWEEPYEPDDEDEPMYHSPPDEITVAVGGSWYATGYTLDECRRTYPGSAIVAHPERFDRFYMRSTVGPILVDLLLGDSDQIDAQRARKNVPFKTAWCAQNGWRYLALAEADLTVDRIRALLSDGPLAEESPKPQAAKARPARRGGIQRPKAAA